jgi:hypothetical protein
MLQSIWSRQVANIIIQILFILEKHLPAACQVPDILTYNTIETEIPEIFLLKQHIIFYLVLNTWTLAQQATWPRFFGNIQNIKEVNQLVEILL